MKDILSRSAQLHDNISNFGLQMEHNYSLQPFNTFGIDVKAKYFATFSNITELQTALNESPKEDLLILGGGSNMLFTQDFDGLVLRNEIKGISVVKESDSHVFVKAGAGEVWHAFVQYCIAQNWCGLENLSLIPGSVGASALQNIGAYGVEIKQVFEKCDRTSGRLTGDQNRVFNSILKAACGATSHSLRVSFVTRCHRAGLSESQAMRLVNHSTRLVHAVYSKLNLSDARAAAALVPPPGGL
jgi:hypothetical protein